MKIFRVCIYILLCQLAASANMLGAGLNTNLKSLKANFEQIISAEGGLEASYYGMLYAKMPNKAKWDYSPPMDKQVFINNGKFAVYEPSLAQAYIGSVQGSSDFFEILSNATPELDSHNKQTGRYIARVDGIEYTLAIDKNGLPISIQYTDLARFSIYLYSTKGHRCHFAKIRKENLKISLQYLIIERIGNGFKNACYGEYL